METLLLFVLVIRSAENDTARTADERVFSQSPAASCLSTADCVKGGILSWLQTRAPPPCPPGAGPQPLEPKGQGKPTGSDPTEAPGAHTCPVP